MNNTPETFVLPVGTSQRTLRTADARGLQMRVCSGTQLYGSDRALLDAIISDWIRLRFENTPTLRKPT